MPRSGYIYREGTTPNTRLLNTQKVKLYSFDAGFDAGEMKQIGLVQTWNPTQSRTIEPVRGVGFGDHIAEQAVGVTELTATCSVMMMYLRDIMQLFGYKSGSSGFIRSLQHHRWPFDVKEEIVVPEFIRGEAQNLNRGEVILTWYEACWMSDYTKSFDIGAASVTQDTTMNITDIYAEPFTGDDGLEDANTSNNKASTLYSER